MKIFIPIILYIFASFTEEAAFYWIHQPGNLRPSMIENSSLMSAAQWRAEYVDSTGFFNHCTKEGDCPNRIIKRFGCNHPYNENGNAVESIVKGTKSAKKAFDSLLSSEFHRQHLLGTNSMTVKQIYYGVGYSGFTYVFLSSEKC
jgi:uncharacterized protein YkwD